MSSDEPPEDEPPDAQAARAMAAVTPMARALSPRRMRLCIRVPFTSL